MSENIKVQWNENRKPDQPDNVNPSHYQTGNIQVIDFILDQKMSYLIASATKYLCRYPHKHKAGEGRLDDLRKARWFIEKQIEQILKEENIK
jgi:hypothetical protein|tara:strand:+ start:216 stop:491 length:276 start_codon:yes stop_codon:yes gene_type:complete